MSSQSGVLILILIALGSSLLLYTRFGISLSWLEEWWPVVPIAFGAWLVAKGFRNGMGSRD